MLTHVSIESSGTVLHWSDKTELRLPHLWLRDNCPCHECRIEQTSEKQFLISSVPVDLAPVAVSFDERSFALTWPDGHLTRFQTDQLTKRPALSQPETQYWGHDFRPLKVDFAEFLSSNATAMTAIRAFLSTGALVLTQMPGVSGTVEQLQPRLGRIREMPFGRLHDVIVDPTGYNVAHTSLPLPPHNDFASTNWPPSIQALHMLVNECEGGESVIVDGWAVAESLRRDRPDLFDVLCEVPVPFRMFSADEETSASNPLIRLDRDGTVAHLRYSNQLMQPLDPSTTRLESFYAAYHELTTRLTSDQARAVFRLESGQCLLVAGHRVLHAREAFTPSGRRHLQDAYFEHDCFRNHLIVLERKEENAND